MFYIYLICQFSVKKKENLESNNLYSVQAINVSKHCWMLKQKIIAIFDNDVFHEIDTIFYLAVVDRNNCYCEYIQLLIKTFPLSTFLLLSNFEEKIFLINNDFNL